MNIPQVSSAKLDLPAAGSARDSPRPAAAKGPQVSAAVAPPTADSAREHQSSPAQTAESVQQMNRAMRMANSALQFSLDQDADRVVVTLTDRDTGEVVMQIPSEEALALARHLNEAAEGALVSQKA